MSVRKSGVTYQKMLMVHQILNMLIYWKRINQSQVKNLYVLVS